MCVHTYVHFYSSLDIWAGDTSSSVISSQVVIKTMSMDEVTQRKYGAREPVGPGQSSGAVPTPSRRRLGFVNVLPGIVCDVAGGEERALEITNI